MFEKLTTPEEIFSFKLGAALKMGETNLEADAQPSRRRDEEPHRQHREVLRVARRGGRRLALPRDRGAREGGPGDDQEDRRQLITHAEARGANAVAELLKRNLEDERHTLQELQQVTQRIANDGIAVAA